MVVWICADPARLRAYAQVRFDLYTESCNVNHCRCSSCRDRNMHVMWSSGRLGHFETMYLWGVHKLVGTHLTEAEANAILAKLSTSITMCCGCSRLFAALFTKQLGLLFTAPTHLMRVAPRSELACTCTLRIEGEGVAREAAKIITAPYVVNSRLGMQASAPMELGASGRGKRHRPQQVAASSRSSSSSSSSSSGGR